MEQFEYANVKSYHQDLIQRAQVNRQLKIPTNCKPTLIEKISLLLINLTITVGNLFILPGKVRRTRSLKELAVGCD
jgi:hypothetical protein